MLMDLRPSEEVHDTTARAEKNKWIVKQKEKSFGQARVEEVAEHKTMVAQIETG